VMERGQREKACCAAALTLSCYTLAVQRPCAPAPLQSAADEVRPRVCGRPKCGRRRAQRQSTAARVRVRRERSQRKSAAAGGGAGPASMLRILPSSMHACRSALPLADTRGVRWLQQRAARGGPRRRLILPTHYRPVFCAGAVSPSAATRVVPA